MLQPETKLPPVAILSQGKRSWASSRLRGAWLADSAPDLFRWYSAEEEMALLGYKVLVFQKRHSKEDVALAKMAKERGIKIVNDLTDPLWWFDPQAVGAMMQIANVVTVSSEGLKDAVEQGGLAKRVVVIPDRMLPAFHPTVAQHGKRDVATLVWFGLAANRVSLVGALNILTYVANMGHKFRLRVIDDNPLARIEGQGPFEVEHIPWTLETFHAQLTACDIAVLPPYPGPWGTLKSNNKAVTAWWAGLPVSDGYDPRELVELIEDADCRKDIGAKNRKVAEQEYDIAQSVKQWRELIAELGVKS